MGQVTKLKSMVNNRGTERVECENKIMNGRRDVEVIRALANEKELNPE